MALRSRVPCMWQLSPYSLLPLLLLSVAALAERNGDEAATIQVFRTSFLQHVSTRAACAPAAMSNSTDQPCCPTEASVGSPSHVDGCICDCQENSLPREAIELAEPNDGACTPSEHEGHEEPCCDDGHIGVAVPSGCRGCFCGDPTQFMWVPSEALAHEAMGTLGFHPTAYAKLTIDQARKVIHAFDSLKKAKSEGWIASAGPPPVVDPMTQKALMPSLAASGRAQSHSGRRLLASLRSEPLFEPNSPGAQQAELSKALQKSVYHALAPDGPVANAFAVGKNMSTKYILEDMPNLFGLYMSKAQATTWAEQNLRTEIGQDARRMETLLANYKAADNDAERRKIAQEVSAYAAKAA